MNAIDLISKKLEEIMYETSEELLWSHFSKYQIGLKT